jgi:hypothetical protein
MAPPEIAGMIEAVGGDHLASLRPEAGLLPGDGSVRSSSIRQRTGEGRARLPRDSGSICHRPPQSQEPAPSSAMKTAAWSTMKSGTATTNRNFRVL